MEGNNTIHLMVNFAGYLKTHHKHFEFFMYEECSSFHATNQLCRLFTHFPFMLYYFISQGKMCLNNFLFMVCLFLGYGFPCDILHIHRFIPFLLPLRRIFFTFFLIYRYYKIIFPSLLSNYLCFIIGDIIRHKNELVSILIKAFATNYIIELDNHRFFIILV